MKSLLFAATLLSLILITTSAAPQNPAAPPVNGLQMSIAPVQTQPADPQAIHFTITFTNTSDAVLTFAPGTTLDCGRRPSMTSLVVLNLTDPKGKLHHNMMYAGDGPPYIGFCAGRIDPFVVVLHAHESISLPLDISKYFDLKNSKQYEMARFSAGAYLVEAAFTSSDQPIRQAKSWWAGTVKSNVIQIQFNSDFAAALDDVPDRKPPTAASIQSR
jgi:hypothetical protein